METTASRHTKRTMSSMCPSVSSPSMPEPSQKMDLAPSMRRNSSSIMARLHSGLRLGFSSTDSVVTSRPSPLPSIAPPSRTMEELRTGSPREAPIREGMPLSRSHGANLPPQALNCQSASIREPSSTSCTKTGPWSRHQTSLAGWLNRRYWSSRTPAACIACLMPG